MSKHFVTEWNTAFLFKNKPARVSASESPVVKDHDQSRWPCLDHSTRFCLRTHNCCQKFRKKNFIVIKFIVDFADNLFQYIFHRRDSWTASGIHHYNCKVDFLLLKFLQKGHFFSCFQEQNMRDVTIFNQSNDASSCLCRKGRRSLYIQYSNDSIKRSFVNRYTGIFIFHDNRKQFREGESLSNAITSIRDFIIVPSIFLNFRDSFQDFLFVIRCVLSVVIRWRVSVHPWKRHRTIRLSTIEVENTNGGC